MDGILIAAGERFERGYDGDLVEKGDVIAWQHGHIIIYVCVGVLL